MKKGAKLYGILTCVCPKCHEGKVFISNIPSSLNFIKMKKTCNVCQHTFEKEPGFFFGAMYVSYAIGVALCFISYITILVYFPDIKLEWQIGITFSLIVVLIPFLFRFSRIAWMHLFTNYEP